ncbi:MAG: 2-hydroxyacid dehydrogenase [Humibacillus sp.]
MSRVPLVVSVPDESYAAGLDELEGVDVVAWDMQGPHPRGAEVRLAVMPYMTHLSVRRVTEGLTSLGAIQIQSAGFENFLDGLPAGVDLCNAAGVHDASTAELAVGLALASLRHLPDFVVAQRDSRWLPQRDYPALADRRVLVLGYGNIGRAVVRRLLPFEVSVSVVASRARAGDELVDTVHGIDELPELVTAADVLIVIVPLTASTHGLVDAALLARMPDGGLVVNVARGPVVDTDALVAECATGRLRAALDVTDPEPLPEDHPLWLTPGVLIAPHVGGATDAMRPRAEALIRRQVLALRDGHGLINVVATG